MGGRAAAAHDVGPGGEDDAAEPDAAPVPVYCGRQAVTGQWESVCGVSLGSGFPEPELDGGTAPDVRRYAGVPAW